ncbi:hypothetical protein GCM10007183_07110 [Staphylococcus muscae]|uniref:ABC transporter ATP-binding protein n=1 Tax=Staphylococcus muscae TaxID=1294 RepID=A0ABQ1HR75_9STAP|nr:hypothetical protein GCM10007183_07110 [Staphylococcus muscae]
MIDETFSNIDKESVDIFLVQIENLSEQNNTCIIITSHNNVLRSYLVTYTEINL